MWPTDADIDNDRPTWTPIDKAAALSGKSDRTLRRWVASGKIAHKREAGRLFVDLSSPALTGGDTGIAPPIDNDLSTARQQIATLTAELDRLQTVNDLLERELSDWKALADRLATGTLNQQKLIEATVKPARPWRWPWSKTGG